MAGSWRAGLRTLGTTGWIGDRRTSATTGGGGSTRSPPEWVGSWGQAQSEGVEVSSTSGPLWQSAETAAARTASVSESDSCTHCAWHIGARINHSTATTRPNGRRRAKCMAKEAFMDRDETLPACVCQRQRRLTHVTSLGICCAGVTRRRQCHPHAEHRVPDSASPAVSPAFWTRHPIHRWRRAIGPGSHRNQE